MRKVWRLVFVHMDGSRVSAVIPPPWMRTYIDAEGRKQTVSRCLAFSTRADAKWFAVAFGPLELWSARAESAKKVQFVSRFEPGNAAFEAADGKPDGWEKMDAPTGTLYCHDLRLTGEKPVATFGE